MIFKDVIILKFYLNEIYYLSKIFISFFFYYYARVKFYFLLLVSTYFLNNKIISWNNGNNFMFYEA